MTLHPKPAAVGSEPLMKGFHYTPTDEQAGQWAARAISVRSTLQGTMSFAVFAARELEELALSETEWSDN